MPALHTLARSIARFLLGALVLCALSLGSASGQAPAGLYYIHVDHLNTPRAIYNDQQQLVWRWDQAEPFGSSPPNENPSGLGTFECNLRFAGQYFDKETNLAYNYFRDFDPGLGRYVQSDPIGLRGGLLTYSYSSQTPLTSTDPRGLIAYTYRITSGGGVSPRPPITGRLVNLSVTDPIKGQTCNYTVSCIGIGMDLHVPEMSAGSHHVKWDDGKMCSDCRQHEGYGWAGFAGFPWGTVSNWFEVPNGPRLDFSGGSLTEIALGGGTYFCRFTLR